VTRSRVQRLIDHGAVRLNDRPVTRASSRVGAGDVISIDLPDRRPRLAPAAEPLPLDIRYEDDELLIVNKPPGQVSHPAVRHRSGTLLNALLGYASLRWPPSLVSRLDKGTSGLTLVAKSRAMHTELQKLSAENAIEKEYLAIVRGTPPSRGAIDLALGRDPWDERRVVVRDRGGVPCITHFRRLRRMTSDDGSPVSALRCRLVTGRMHQIRVHLAARGWPILGDVTYGVPYAGMDRQALHAWRLAFVHPIAGHEVDVTAPAPDDMAALLRGLDASEIGEDGREG
jgi:23S rRNA pseudouridine1911/1915/1917 synthase